jgi:hypothetical protein
MASPQFPQHGDPMLFEHPLLESQREAEAAATAAPAPDPHAAPAAAPPARDPLVAVAESMQENARATRDILDSFLTRQAQPAPAAQLPPDPGPMPTEGDTIALQRWFDARDARLEARVRGEITGVRGELQEEQLAQTMWTEILSDPVTSALARENQDLFANAWREAGGRVPQNADPRAFKQKIVDNVRARVARAAQFAAPAPPAPAVDPNVPGTAPAPAIPVAPAAPAAAQPNRTAGLSGPSAQVARPKAESSDPNRGLLDDLTEVQLASPYF